MSGANSDKFLAKFNFFALKNMHAGVHCRLPDKYNCRAHFKPTRHLTLLKSDGCVRMFRWLGGKKVIKRSFLALNISFVKHVRSFWHWLVGGNVFIKIELNRAYIERTNVGEEEEVVLTSTPVPKYVDSLVVFKNILVVLDIGRLYW